MIALARVLRWATSTADTAERARSISPDQVVEDAEAGRLVWDQISEEQRRKHWGAL